MDINSAIKEVRAINRLASLTHFNDMWAEICDNSLVPVELVKYHETLTGKIFVVYDYDNVRRSCILPMSPLKFEAMSRVEISQAICNHDGLA